MLPARNDVAVSEGVMIDHDLHPCMLYRVVAVLVMVLIMGAVCLFGGCATAACATVATLEAEPAPESPGLPGLLVRMGRELVLSVAREKCRE